MNAECGLPRGAANRDGSVAQFCRRSWLVGSMVRRRAWFLCDDKAPKEFKLSDTFLMYVHKQIAHLTVGVAEGMAQTFPISNVEGATTSGS